MPNFDLLSAVQPEEGRFCIVGIRNGDVTQKFADTREQADDLIEKFKARELDVYFGVAKYGAEKNRKKGNVVALKSLWVDLDCGEGKPYAKQADALKALKKFCASTEMPLPAVVDSGRGIHAYWPLEESIGREEWERVAESLRRTCAAEGLKADTSCFEAARILRVPDTFNYKQDPPLSVSVLAPAGPVSLDKLKSQLHVPEAMPAAFDGFEGGMSDLGRQIKPDDNFDFSFMKIMRREDSCRQLHYMYKHRRELEYDKWFAALSVANRCHTDREESIHKLSRDHPGYSPEETEKIASSSEAPARCDYFERVNPDGCKGCPHLGKIKSPIVLGKVMQEATEEDRLVEGENQLGNTQQYEIPEYIFPYKRGKNGGLFKKGADGEDDQLIYEEDLYVVKRITDPKIGEQALIRHHTPREGVKEYPIPYSMLMGDHGALRSKLGFYGVLLAPKKFAFLADFLTKTAFQMRKDKDVENVREQFGWTENLKHFVVGETEYDAVRGERFAPVSSMLKRYAKKMQPTGDYQKWKDVVDMYGKVGMEGHAFAVATGLGSTLMHMTGQNGGIVNMIHPRSGQGKTTILRVVASFWGDPTPGKDSIVAGPSDTYNARITKAGWLNSIPACYDELSNMTPLQMSEFAYIIPFGSGKDRMMGMSNELRENDTTWNTIAVCSSNQSFYEILERHPHRDMTEGEMMRIFEYHVPNEKHYEPAYAKEMFDTQLAENFGFAGRLFVQYVLNNYDAVKAQVKARQKFIDKKLGLVQRERVWSAVMAANITAIDIAKMLGIITTWDIERILAWAGNHVRTLREQVTPPDDRDVDILTDFINRHAGHILAIEGNMDARKSKFKALPRMEPRNELAIRIEPDTRRIYIAAAALKRDFARNGVSYKAVVDDLKARGLCIDAKPVRLSKGMAVDMGAPHCLIFDADHAAFTLDVDSFVDAKETKEEGEEA
tara:strand:- start:6087 stop:8930 length:2844 start_codon:yes stop_codon:yes gene_type:complete